MLTNLYFKENKNQYEGGEANSDGA